MVCSIVLRGRQPGEVGDVHDRGISQSRCCLECEWSVTGSTWRSWWACTSCKEVTLYDTGQGNFAEVLRGVLLSNLFGGCYGRSSATRSVVSPERVY